MALDTATKNNLLEIRHLLQDSGFASAKIDQHSGRQMQDTGQLLFDSTGALVPQDITSYGPFPFAALITPGSISQPLTDKLRSAGQRIMKAMNILNTLLEE